MLFSLTNTPSTFQYYINNVLFKFLDNFYTVYINNVLIYSDSLKEYKIHVCKVLDKLRATGLQLDITKCKFYVQKVTYLSLIVSSEGIKIDLSKVKAIVK